MWLKRSYARFAKNALLDYKTYLIHHTLPPSQASQQLLEGTTPIYTMKLLRPAIIHKSNVSYLWTRRGLWIPGVYKQLKAEALAGEVKRKWWAYPLLCRATCFFICPLSSPCALFHVYRGIWRQSLRLINFYWGGQDNIDVSPFHFRITLSFGLSVSCMRRATRNASDIVPASNSAILKLYIVMHGGWGKYIAHQSHEGPYLEGVHGEDVLSLDYGVQEGVRSTS